MPVMYSIAGNNQCKIEYECPQSRSGCYYQHVVLSIWKTIVVLEYAQTDSDLLKVFNHEFNALCDGGLYREEVGLG
jgi:hypothetical protein